MVEDGHTFLSLFQLLLLLDHLGTMPSRWRLGKLVCKDRDAREQRQSSGSKCKRERERLPFKGHGLQKQEVCQRKCKVCCRQQLAPVQHLHGLWCCLVHAVISKIHVPARSCGRKDEGIHNQVPRKGWSPKKDQRGLPAWKFQSRSVAIQKPLKGQVK